MRIGFVTGEYPPMQGGVGAFTAALATALADEHSTHIFTHHDARPGSEDRNWRRLQEPFDGPGGLVYPFGRRWGWPDIGRIADWAIRYEIDVVNIQYQAAAYDMRRLGIHLLPWRLRGVVPTVVTFHDLRVPFLFPKAGGLRAKAVFALARQADGVIATNLADAEVLAERGVSRVERIPIGSNIPPLDRDEARIATLRRLAGVGDNGFLLGYFGFLNATKGADTLIDALAQLPPSTRLVLIGGQTGASDPANNATFGGQLRARIEALGLTDRIHETGFIDDAAVSAWLHAADLMALPYHDGASLRRGSLMAALAHGRPILSIQPAAPMPELRHRENIWLAPSADAPALVEAIAELIELADLRRRLGEGAAELAKMYEWSTIAKQTANYLKTVWQSSPTARPGRL